MFILNVPGTNKQIQVGYHSRRYPGTVFKWASWRFVGEGHECWRDIGDPFSGRGALQEIREVAITEALETLTKPQFYATSDLIGRTFDVNGNEYRVVRIETSYSVRAMGSDGLKTFRVSAVKQKEQRETVGNHCG